MTSRREVVRVFVAVRPSDEARGHLAAAVERIQSQIPEGIQWAIPDGLHLTLKFLGDIPSENVAPLLVCMAEAAALQPAFRLRLGGLGMFPNRHRPRVLWAGIGGDTDALGVLQQAAEANINSLGYRPEERPFRPHITLGRPRRRVADKQLARIGDVVESLDPPPAVSWHVDYVQLMRSELHPTGAIYTVLGEAPLAGIGAGNAGDTP